MKPKPISPASPKPLRSKKSWREKLADDKGLPKVIRIEGKLSKRWGEGTCAIPAPREVDALIRRVPRGKLTTIESTSGGGCAQASRDDRLPHYDGNLLMVGRPCRR